MTRKVEPGGGPESDDPPDATPRLHPTTEELTGWQLRRLESAASLPITEHVLGCRDCLAQARFLELTLRALGRSEADYGWRAPVEAPFMGGPAGLAEQRAGFARQVAIAIARAEQSLRSLSVVIFDIDDFAHYNDRHGRPAGDEVLRLVERLLGEEEGSDDRVARWSGDAFALLLMDMDHIAARRKAKRICRRMARYPFPHGARQPGGALTVSFGMATWPEDVPGGPATTADSSEVLIQIAEAALLRAIRRRHHPISEDADLDFGLGLTPSTG